MHRIALLANPESGAGRADEVERRLAATWDEVVRIEIAEADRALGVDAERLVVAGGDGSVGPAAALASRAGLPLGVIPVGTANDFARALGLPGSLDEAIAIAARGAERRRIELGWMRGGEAQGERAFVNVASLGLPPAAARGARELKRGLGAAAYAVGALRAAVTTPPVRCRIADGDGREVFAGEAWQATIACSGHFGAGSRVDADPGDGLLDAVAVEAGSRLALARRAWGMRRGGLEEQPGVHRRRAPEFLAEVPEDTAFNVDGEVCVRSGEVRFAVDPDAVEVVVG